MRSLQTTNTHQELKNARTLGAGLMAGGEVLSGFAGVVALVSLAASFSRDAGAGSLFLAAQAAGLAQGLALLAAIVFFPRREGSRDGLLRWALVPGVLTPLLLAIPWHERVTGMPGLLSAGMTIGLLVSLISARCCRKGQVLFRHGHASGVQPATVPARQAA